MGGWQSQTNYRPVVVDCTNHFISLSHRGHDRHLPRPFFRMVTYRLLASHDATHRDHDGCRSTHSNVESNHPDVHQLGATRSQKSRQGPAQPSNEVNYQSVFWLVLIRLRVIGNPRDFCHGMDFDRSRRDAIYRATCFLGSHSNFLLPVNG